MSSVLMGHETSSTLSIEEGKGNGGCEHLIVLAQRICN